MQVKDVMHTDVKTISQGSSVKEAAEIMKEHRIGSLVVLEKHKMLGILTERDILDKVVAEASDSSKVKVKDVMTTEVVMAFPEQDLGAAASLMLEKGIKKLPVLHGKQLVGIVTATDVCAAEPKMMEQIGALMLVTKKKTVAG